MELNKPLSELCLDGLYNYGKRIVHHILESNGEDKERLQFTLQRLMSIFKLWNLSNFIERFEAVNVKWEVCVQNLQNTEYSTITLSFQTSIEYERFKAFLRHLISNWFRDVKVQKLHAGNLSFVVTYPVPVLLHIYPQSYAPCDEHARLSTSKSSDVETVLKVLKNILTKDFIFSCTLNQSERKEKIEGEHRFINPDYKHDTLPDLLLNQLTEAYVSVPKAGHSLYCPDHFDSDGSQTETINILMAQNSEMRRTIQEMNYALVMQSREYHLGYEKYVSEIRRLQTNIEEKDAELYATMLDLGRVSVELQRLQNDKVQSWFFDRTYNSHTASTQTIGASATSLVTRSEVNRGEVMDRRGPPFESSIQESLNNRANLANMHAPGVEGSIYNNYKWLLLRIAHDLLKEDVTKLRLWVATQFGLDASLNVKDILVELDRKGVISVTDLSRLRKFFEENALRYDFVCLIDSYLLGDYDQLKKPSVSRERSTFRRQSSLPDSWSSWRTSVVSDQDATEASQDTAVDSFHRVLQRRFLRAPRSREVGQTPTQALSSSAQTGLMSLTTNSHEHQASNSQSAVAGARSENDVQTSASNVPLRGDDTSNTSRNAEQESNRQTSPKPQTPDSSNSIPERHEWLCTHYKRNCYVQFECCDQFWPCHRCHNNQSSCGRRKLKSRDTKRIKCAVCGEEQEFAHRCSRCNLQFAMYFCALCKHLTGTDDNPYHCDKCGICRIHGDRSFHCDVCGVCLDVQLRGNHKCREGSAHDECCICLEDAFTGCQILPCSHKVHKDCASQMISSGITRCPICRESFEHKLEKKSAKKFGRK